MIRLFYATRARACALDADDVAACVAAAADIAECRDFLRDAAMFITPLPISFAAMIRFSSPACLSPYCHMLFTVSLSPPNHIAL